MYAKALGASALAKQLLCEPEALDSVLTSGSNLIAQ